MRIIDNIIKKVNNMFTSNVGKNTVAGGMPANTDRMAGKSNDYRTKEAGTKIDENDAVSWNRETHPKGVGPSKLVKEIHYDNRDGDNTLSVTYRDGYTAEYDNVDPNEVRQFQAADSKGRWALKHLWNRPYRGA